MTDIETDSKGKKVFYESQIHKMSQAEWDANEADILSAEQEGRIVLDMSGRRRK